MIMKLLVKKLFNEKAVLLEQLLNESFGFDYIWPDNKNQAIYDFYALSLIDPWRVDFGSIHDDPIIAYGTKQNLNKSDPKYHDYIELEDLRFSLQQAKLKNAAEMKKFMTEAIRRAVICEMQHFKAFYKDFWEDKFLKELSGSPDLAKVYKKMKTIYNPQGLDHIDYLASPGDHEPRYDAFMNNPIKVSDEELFGLSSKAFHPDYWDGGMSYGGKNWVNVANGGLELIHAPDLSEKNAKTMAPYQIEEPFDKLMSAIDHAVDLAHNNGTIFTKWPSLHVKTGTLETKRYITNIKAYIHDHGVESQPPTLVSDTLKDAITYLARYEKLTKQDLRYTKKDKNSREEKTYDLYTNEEIETTVYDKLTDDENAEAVRKVLTEIGIHDTPDAMAAMSVEVNKVLKNINYNKSDPKTVLDQKTKEWSNVFNETLGKLEKSFGVDKINTHNRTLIIRHLDELTRGVSTRKRPSFSQQGITIYTDYESKLKELMNLPWIYSGKESLDSLIARYKITRKIRLTSEDYDYLEKWLKNHYKDDYQEFEIFVNHFIPDFEKMSQTKMTPKQMEYIDHLIDKAKSKGYSRRMEKQDQPALEL
jgi:hypothetical protein